jgi:hypothetical protein
MAGPDDRDGGRRDQVAGALPLQQQIDKAIQPFRDLT